MQIPRSCRALLGVLALAAGCLGAARAEAEPAMWVVKDADSTVYLLGTIHVLKPGTEWRSDKLQSALQGSDEFWMEADVEADKAVAQTYALNFGMDTRHSLAETVGEKNYARLVEVAKRYGIPTERLPQMRPWLATLALLRAQMMGVGYDPELGVDRSLEREAMAAGKPVKTFETAEQQLGVLADLPDKVAAEMLIQTLDELDAGIKLLDALAAAWLAGDTKQIRQTAVDRMREEAPEVYDAIIVQRNNRWVKQIQAMLKGAGTQFIAVGAAHLVGKESVPEQLARLGFKVARY